MKILKIQLWFENIGYITHFDAKWHWYRFEYQPRSSIHCHSVAKLNNDPGLCKLSDTALKGYMADVSEDESTPDS